MMNKISLVARRKNRNFNEPTAAMKRAQEREDNRDDTDTIEEIAPEPVEAVDTLWETEPVVSDTYEVDSKTRVLKPSESRPAPGPELVLETNVDKTISRYCTDKMTPNEDRVLETRISKRTRRDNVTNADQTYISVTFLEHEQTTLLTSQEVAVVMKVKTATVIRMARIGKLKGYKIGRSWRFRWEDVLDSFKQIPTIQEGA